MNPIDRIPPHQRGGGAHWVQALYLLLHIALLIALFWMAYLFWGVQQRVGFEPWQKIVFLVLFVTAFTGFSWRTLRTVMTLVRGGRSRRRPKDTSS